MQLCGGKSFAMNDADIVVSGIGPCPTHAPAPTLEGSVKKKIGFPEE
jgi:hypothetical protein